MRVTSRVSQHSSVQQVGSARSRALLPFARARWLERRSLAERCGKTDLGDSPPTERAAEPAQNGSDSGSAENLFLRLVAR